MEIPDGIVAWGFGLVVAHVAGSAVAVAVLKRSQALIKEAQDVRFKAVEDEVKGLRAWRHDVVAPYCSHLESEIVELQTQMKDVSRRLNNINGDRK